MTAHEHIRVESWLGYFGAFRLGALRGTSLVAELGVQAVVIQGEADGCEATWVGFRS